MATTDVAAVMGARPLRVRPRLQTVAIPDSRSHFAYSVLQSLERR